MPRTEGSPPGVSPPRLVLPSLPSAASDSGLGCRAQGSRALLPGLGRSEWQACLKLGVAGLTFLCSGFLSSFSRASRLPTMSAGGGPRPLLACLLTAKKSPCALRTEAATSSVRKRTGTSTGYANGDRDHRRGLPGQRLLQRGHMFPGGSMGSLTPQQAAGSSHPPACLFKALSWDSLLAKLVVSPNSTSAQPTAALLTPGCRRPRPPCALQRVELVGVFNEAAFVLLSVLCLGDPVGRKYGQRQALRLASPKLPAGSGAHPPATLARGSRRSNWA